MTTALSVRRRSSQGPPGFPSSPQPTQTPCSQGPARPTLRANPFPEVTDLFCRLPLPTLSHQLEAVHLGDLLRFSVRTGVNPNPSPRFSRAVEGAPDPTEASDHSCHRTLAPDDPISGCLDS
jgi:hypothetical protein